VTAKSNGTIKKVRCNKDGSAASVHVEWPGPPPETEVVPIEPDSKDSWVTAMGDDLHVSFDPPDASWTVYEFHR